MEILLTNINAFDLKQVMMAQGLPRFSKTEYSNAIFNQTCPDLIFLLFMLVDRNILGALECVANT